MRNFISLVTQEKMYDWIFGSFMKFLQQVNALGQIVRRVVAAAACRAAYNGMSPRIGYEGSLASPLSAR